MTKQTLVIRKSGYSYKITVPIDFVRTNEVCDGDIVLWRQDEHGVHLEFAKIAPKELVQPWTPPVVEEPEAQDAA